jgi:hypothetical protein
VPPWRLVKFPMKPYPVKTKYLTVKQCSVLPPGAVLSLEPTNAEEERHRILYKILTNDGVNFAIQNVKDSDGSHVPACVSRLGDEWEGFLRHWRISRIAEPTPGPEPTPKHRVIVPFPKQ